jgi:hypothetical protein
MSSQITDASALTRAQLLAALSLTSYPKVGLAALGLRRIDMPDGAWLLEGRRAGRRVRVDVGQGLSVTTVGTPGAEFRAVASGGCLHPAAHAPKAVLGALRSLGPSARWTDLEAVGGGDGVLIARRSQTGGSWPYDVWLAERLVAALAAPRGEQDAPTASVQVEHFRAWSC